MTQQRVYVVHVVLDDQRFAVSFVHVRAQEVLVAKGLVAVLAKRFVVQNVRRIGGLLAIIIVLICQRGFIFFVVLLMLSAG